ncbi:hypothetical protein ACFOYU_15910 [Microvirga sp. GCM10011540]|uniref:hypothetical protein n=1 Tax=Microvirga sp. GCM10011540 TaxID=3317338 RepID=UPI00361B2FEC
MSLKAKGQEAKAVVQLPSRQTTLRKGGHMRGVVGIALGQFTDFKPSGTLTVVDLLRDRLAPPNVPIL